ACRPSCDSLDGARLDHQAPFYDLGGVTVERARRRARHDGAAGIEDGRVAWTQELFLGLVPAVGTAEVSAARVEHRELSPVRSRDPSRGALLGDDPCVALARDEIDLDRRAGFDLLRAADVDPVFLVLLEGRRDEV